MMKTPQRLKGFNDFFGEDMQIRNYVKSLIQKTYEKYGFEPLETPALEYTELMLGQSGEEAEKQYYRFTDQGGRDVMLKFEVMISMCRALAQNINNTPLPFKRYQVQPVWRAENVQKGRYREFTQCDADTIGSSAMTADAEIIQMQIELMQKIGFSDFKARISNRKFLEGLSNYLDISDEKFYGFSMSIDKLEKIGADKVVEEMETVRGIDSEQAKKAMEIIANSELKQMNFAQKLNYFGNTVGTVEKGKKALNELSQILEYFQTANINEKFFDFDSSIARGLASYTGPVWEFTVIEGGVGSVSGAGRYDKAIGKYLGFDVPATGCSFGLERICDIIKDRNMLNLGSTSVQVMIVNFDQNSLKSNIELAGKLRDAGIRTMLYPDTVKLDKQFKYADKKNIKYVILLGEEEIKSNKVTLKNMQSGEQKMYNLEDIIKLIS
jgi:histidyl-tRNA synthetase